MYKLNSNACKYDVAAAVRSVLSEYIDDYKSFEMYLLSQIPDVSSNDVFLFGVMNSSEEPDCSDEDENPDEIRNEIQRIQKLIL